MLESLKIGDSIEVQEFNPETKQMDWVKSEIERVTNDFLWFKGTGFCRVRRTTVDKGIFYRRITK